MHALLSTTRRLGAAALAVLAAAAPWALAQVDSPPAELAALADRAHSAFYRGDRAALVEVQTVLESTHVAGSSPLVEYYIAYTDYRIALLTPEEERAEARMHYAACTGRTGRALKGADSLAEGWILLGACRAGQARTEPLRAFYHTPLAGRALNRAEEIDPDNPRLPFVRALVAEARPGVLGGVDPAAELRAAVTAFDSLDADERPYWGHADSWVALGRIYLERDDLMRARDAFENALLVAPEYVQASRMLDDVIARLGSRRLQSSPQRNARALKPRNTADITASMAI